MSYLTQRRKTGSWDSSIRKWDVSTNRFIAELLGHHDPVYCLAAVGGVLLSGSRDCCVRAWRTDTCECIRTYEGHTAVVSSVLAGTLSLSLTHTHTRIHTHAHMDTCG